MTDNVHLLSGHVNRVFGVIAASAMNDASYANMAANAAKSITLFCTWSWIYISAVSLRIVIFVVAKNDFL